MSSAPAGPRALKRQRTNRNNVDAENVRSAISALLERLAAVRSNTESARDHHLATISVIDERIATKQTALRAAARVVPPPPSEDIAAFSRGVPARSSSIQQPDVTIPPLPAMKLLMEPDPPEKLIHEQSIIVRAQAINRKNAELARERLPKQPEAQRNKTYWDFFTDEALWLATDFREERKWKIQVARKLARAVAAHHVQKRHREVKAQREENIRLRKLASSVAKDVKKFWSQIRELAEMRAAEAAEIQASAQREQQLQDLLKKSETITSELAKSLRNATSSSRTHVPMPDCGNKARSSENLALSPSNRPSLSNGVEKTPLSLSPSSQPPGADGEFELSPSPELRSSRKRPRETSNGGYASDTSRGDQSSLADDADDEATMAAAEAEDENDPEEITRLESEANLTVEELLRAQGIDPSAYAADNRRYLSSEEDSDIESIGTSESIQDADADCSDEEPRDSSTPLQSTSENENQAKSLEILGYSSRTSTSPSMIANRGSNGDKKELINIPSSVVPTGIAAPERNDHVMGKLSPNNVHSSPPRLFYKLSEPHTCLKSLENSKVAQGTESLSKAGVVSESEMFISLCKLLRGTLRDYQREGTKWLTTLHEQGVNGILADEMGLGKTIQTIALLAWLALEKGTWGPHLVVVPTSVMVNWEVEFKKWLPGFKVLTYFGSLKERKAKRVGWSQPNSFHVCITSYSLVVQDASALRRKKWVYLILDEAHNIKNFQSQRWQTLLSFSTERRLLLTGTPLQNSVMELWSLMHFLMPDMFRSHSEFKDWFANPLAVANSEMEGDPHVRMRTVERLHKLLRPFLLRRLKKEVEKGLPPKIEHVQKCPLSKRQRQLYEDFLSRSDTQSTLDRGDFFGVMGVLMQLRKVCNHPDLFEGRPILSPLATKAIFYPIPAAVIGVSKLSAVDRIDLSLLNLDLATEECKPWSGSWHSKEVQRLSAVPQIVECLSEVSEMPFIATPGNGKKAAEAAIEAGRRVASFRRAILRHHAQLTSMKVRKRALLGEDLLNVVSLTPSSLIAQRAPKNWDDPSQLGLRLIWSLPNVARRACEIAESFVCCIRKVSSPMVEMRFAGDDAHQRHLRWMATQFAHSSSHLRGLFRVSQVRSAVTLPDIRLIQWDCGKLQVLAKLLRELNQKSSRVLIFTQMSKVLNILESFLNLHGYRYLRLDGATKTGERQRIVERFNTDTRIFCMILTTRAGGVGINLTGADSVIFYDTDYNPAVDAQAQDRVHRIGQKKTVHIYRLVSEKTVEENILFRANEKRSLEALVISQAGFNTHSFQNRTALRRLVEIRSSTQGRESVSDLSVSGVILNKAPVVSNGKAISTRQPGIQGSEARIAQNPRISNTAEDDCRKNAAENQIRTTVPVHVLSSHSPHGQLPQSADSPNTGLSHKPDEEHEATESQDIRPEESDAYQLLLSKEDEVEQGSDIQDSSNQDVGDFEDPIFAPSQSITRNPSPPGFEKIENSLTPIQRFALRFIESFASGQAEQSVVKSAPVNEAPDVPLGTRAEHSKSSAFGIGTHNALDAESPLDSRELDVMSSCNESMGSADHRVDGAQELSDSDDDDMLFYEAIASTTAQLSSLKALTDTAADIKLYLPLRDGGPEELKQSIVVNGTAAAGLECAEDAAYFPHAYNRMSRTIYATKRQKEKAVLNQKKRQAELEAKRQLELKANSLQRTASSRSAVPAIAPASTSNMQRAGDKKGKGESGSIAKPTAVPVQKRPRVESASRVKVGSSLTASMSSALTSGDGLFSGSNGVSRKNAKKNQRKLSSLYGKAASNASSGMPGDGLGQNNGWTVEEDQKLIDYAALFNCNMAAVADALSLDCHVRGGIRKKRSVRHCVDRWINAIAKDPKGGTPAPCASNSDSEFMSKNFAAFIAAFKNVGGGFREIISSKSNNIAEEHPSHGRAITDAKSRDSRSSIAHCLPPTCARVNEGLSVPQHHQAGYKSYETTTNALARKRWPFIRPARDEGRVSGQRTSAGGTASQKQGGSTTTGRLAQSNTSSASNPQPLSTTLKTSGLKGVPARPGAKPATVARNPPNVSAGRAVSQDSRRPSEPKRPTGQPVSSPTVNPRYAKYQSVGTSTLIPQGTGARVSIGQFGNARPATGVAGVQGSYNILPKSNELAPSSVRRGQLQANQTPLTNISQQGGSVRKPSPSLKGSVPHALQTSQVPATVGASPVVRRRVSATNVRGAPTSTVSSSAAPGSDKVNPSNGTRLPTFPPSVSAPLQTTTTAMNAAAQTVSSMAQPNTSTRIVDSKRNTSSFISVASSVPTASNSTKALLKPAQKSEILYSSGSHNTSNSIAGQSTRLPTGLHGAENPKPNLTSTTKHSSAALTSSIAQAIRQDGQDLRPGNLVPPQSTKPEKGLGLQSEAHVSTVVPEQASPTVATHAAQSILLAGSRPSVQPRAKHSTSLVPLVGFQPKSGDSADAAVGTTDSTKEVANANASQASTVLTPGEGPTGDSAIQNLQLPDMTSQPGCASKTTGNIGQKQGEQMREAECATGKIENSTEKVSKDESMVGEREAQGASK